MKITTAGFQSMDSQFFNRMCFRDSELSQLTLIEEFILEKKNEESSQCMLKVLGQL